MSELPAVSTAWTSLCPFLGVNPKHPLAEDSPEIIGVKEIYSYCEERNPKDPLGEFRTHYKRLPVITDHGETQLSQMMKYMKLLKLSNQSLSTYRKASKALKVISNK